MKNILGLDLGIGSIGWAYVREAQNDTEQSSIVRLGVRVNPLTVDEKQNFEKGKSITTNAERTLKRSARRNLQRYKLRREALIVILKKQGFISDSTILSEDGNHSTFQTYHLRAKAAKEEISLSDFSRVLLMINKKRGYKSSRKIKSTDEGQLIDGLSLAIEMYENGLTPGEFGFSLLKKGKKYLPEFYRSDLIGEYERIWNNQKLFYPHILTDEFKKQLEGKGKVVTVKTFLAKYQLYNESIKTSEKKLQLYKLRSEGLRNKLSESELVFVISELNGLINESSSYLGAISDRSKHLFFNKQTVGEYLLSILESNPNESLRNKVFYRKDYLDEFETIWERQAKFHPELTPSLKEEIRDVVIFHQRKLKSQKGLISFCEFESYPKEIIVGGKKKIKTVGYKVCPKSSPLFQECKIWQTLNNITLIEKSSRSSRPLEEEEKEILFKELSFKDKLSKAEILKILFPGENDLDLNFKEVDGNRTLSAFIKVYQEVIDRSGHGAYNFSGKSADEIIAIITPIFEAIGINTGILSFDSDLPNGDFECQPLYQLWHLLYSFEGDNSNTGIEKLLLKLQQKYGFEKEYGVLLANMNFSPDYGNLSTKALRKILPYLKGGNQYDVACAMAGYRHSKNSLTKEEINNKELKDELSLLPKNSLRSPVVEKIINQMINVINEVSKEYGKPDEIRIELARELKKSAKERAELTENLSKTNKQHEEIRNILIEQFHLKQVSRNDIIRYKLYEELRSRGFKTLYSNQYIRKEDLFSKEIDIEHIIPQSRLFDDSLSNKTLEFRAVNIEKGNKTAIEYILDKEGEEGAEAYRARVEELYKGGAIKRAKYNKLLMTMNEIPTDFLNRDLGLSQYIAKKAKEILESYVRTVVPTTGSITDRLRNDWQLVNVMQELNWDKYHKLGLTETFENRDGHKVSRIIDWTKRNDHRHHAMDALTIAFTKHSHIQYLNNLNAKSDKGGAVSQIEKKELSRNSDGKLIFNPPIPLKQFRNEAKKHLEGILVSTKAKNKVVTRNINITKAKGEKREKLQLTPRGQLHLETVYGSISRYATKLEKVGSGFTQEVIGSVTNKKYRDALLKRLEQFDNNPKLAFTGKNSLTKNPIYLDDNQTASVPEKVKTVSFEDQFTIRKPITPDLKLDKVVDSGIRKILQERLNEYGGDSKAAFSNLDLNPIWLNKQAGIQIKRVAIKGVSNAVALRSKRDKEGVVVRNEKGLSLPTDFVSTGNNHHVAIYRDSLGNYQDNIVSFYEAVARVNCELPIIDKSDKENENWEFLFSMKQNEFFVFPNENTGFNPKEIDLMDEENYALISPNLFRLQSMSKVPAGNGVVRDYIFRHHLETTVERNTILKDITYKQYKSLDFLGNILKVRINNTGKIVSVGEY